VEIIHSADAFFDFSDFVQENKFYFIDYLCLYYSVCSLPMPDVRCQNYLSHLLFFLLFKYFCSSYSIYKHIRAYKHRIMKMCYSVSQRKVLNATFNLKMTRDGNVLIPSKDHFMFRNIYKSQKTKGNIV
jgi:hypothetical protein